MEYSTRVLSTILCFDYPLFHVFIHYVLWCVKIYFSSCFCRYILKIKSYFRSESGRRNWCNNVRWWRWLTDGFFFGSIQRWRAWHDGIWSLTSYRIWKVTDGESSSGTKDWAEAGHSCTQCYLFLHFTCGLIFSVSLNHQPVLLSAGFQVKNWRCQGGNIKET